MVLLNPTWYLIKTLLLSYFKNDHYLIYNILIYIVIQTQQMNKKYCKTNMLLFIKIV